MFTRDDMLRLLSARPFTAFRLVMSDGNSVPIISPEVVRAGRRFAVVGLLDPGATDTAFDRWTVVWYMHVTQAQMLQSGDPPFSSSPPVGPAESPASSPT